jgi:anthranilate synthase component 1
MKALSYEEYERLSEAGRPVPVFREVPGDLRTPVSAFLSLGTRAERAFLLESVLGGERLARYSFLGRDPVAILEVKDGRVLFRDAAGEQELDEGLLDALRSRLRSQPAEIPGLPRACSSACPTGTGPAAEPWPPSPSTTRWWRSITWANASS